MEAPQITPSPEKNSQNSGRASVPTVRILVNTCEYECVSMGREGDPHTLAQGPSVSGSKGLALGMCLASLQASRAKETGYQERVVGCGGKFAFSSPQAVR